MSQPPQEQASNSTKKKRGASTVHLQPWQFKKGQSGNPGGRKPGKSLKEFAKEYIANLTTEERLEYFQGMNKIDIWEMAEGKAQAHTDVTTGGEKLSLQVINYGENNNSTPPVQS